LLGCVSSHFDTPLLRVADYGPAFSGIVARFENDSYLLPLAFSFYVDTEGELAVVEGRRRTPYVVGWLKDVTGKTSTGL
jgi:hypothetical protein